MTLRVGIDVRAGLFGFTGIGRAATELYAALRRRPTLSVCGWGVAWRRPRPGVSLEGVVRGRLPARVQALAARAGLFGVETLTGTLDLFHHTDVIFAPVRRAVEVMTVHDVLYLTHPEWFPPGFAASVRARVAPRAARAALIAASSERTAADLVSTGLAPAERVVVVPLGADHVDATPRADDRAHLARALAAAGLPPPRDERPLVLAPGTREPRKNQLALLESFLALGARGVNASLLFVGPRGWGCDELERRLASLAGRGRVGVLGAVDETTLGTLLRTADVVAYPSLAEGFGLPAAEAMRCGRAVLTSCDTPMADFGGDAVRLVDPHDPADIGAGLHALLADRALREGLGERAARRAERWTWDRTATQVESLYHRAAACVGSGP